MHFYRGEDAANIYPGWSVRAYCCYFIEEAFTSRGQYGTLYSEMGESEICPAGSRLIGGLYFHFLGHADFLVTFFFLTITWYITSQEEGLEPHTRFGDTLLEY